LFCQICLDSRYGLVDINLFHISLKQVESKSTWMKILFLIIVRNEQSNFMKLDRKTKIFPNKGKPQAVNKIFRD